MASNQYITQMTISFIRTKDFKHAKPGLTFHKVIEDSIADLKPDGKGPITERIRNPKFAVRPMGGANFQCVLSFDITSLDDQMRELLIELRNKLKKNFQSWGKYKIHINQIFVSQKIKM